MAITKDSGVRSNMSVGLGELDPADRDLIHRTEIAAGEISGTRGMDVPVNFPHNHEPHVPPLWLMYGVFAALMVLTGLTVAARQVDLGALNIWVALGLALIKALLVAFFFMHLWWDSKFNQLVMVVSLVLLVLFIGISILDTDQYRPALEPPGAYKALPEAGMQ